MHTDLEIFDRMTSSMGLIACSADEVSEAYLTWQSGCVLSKGEKYWQAARRESNSIHDALRFLLPLTTPLKNRVAFVPTQSKWTAYFDNFRRGTNASGPMSVLAGRIGVPSIRLTRREDLVRVQEGQRKRLQYGLQSSLSLVVTAK